MNKLIVIVALFAACPGTGPGPVIANDILDCAEQNLGDIGKAAEELKPFVTGGKVDWSGFWAKVLTFGKDVGSCAGMEIVQQFMTSKPAGTDAASWAAKDVEAKIHARAGVKCIKVDGNCL